MSNNLPCFPCPHKGICCRYGADLTDAEAKALTLAYGADTVTETDEGYRTAVKGDMCGFHLDGLCTIHTSPLYPAVCRAYPWEDGILGGPYQGDRQECPEFQNE